MSGSMSGIIHGVYEQMLNVVMFCKKVKIPFEVFGFTSGGTHQSMSNQDEVILSDLNLKNYLSSRMNQNEFSEAFEFFSSMIYNKSIFEYMGGTPLVNSLIVMNQFIGKFKSENSLDVVNFIVISDGGDGEGVKVDKQSQSTRALYTLYRNDVLHKQCVMRDRTNRTSTQVKQFSQQQQFKKTSKLNLHSMN